MYRGLRSRRRWITRLLEVVRFNSPRNRAGSKSVVVGTVGLCFWKLSMGNALAIASSMLLKLRGICSVTYHLNQQISRVLPANLLIALSYSIVFFDSARNMLPSSGKILGNSNLLFKTRYLKNSFLPYHHLL